MAKSPLFKVFRGAEYIGCCKYAEDAAALVAVGGTGDVRWNGHSKSDIVWREGSEAFPAGNSYDGAADVMRERIEARLARVRASRVPVRLGDCIGR